MNRRIIHIRMRNKTTVTNSNNALFWQLLISFAVIIFVESLIVKVENTWLRIDWQNRLDINDWYFWSDSDSTACLSCWETVIIKQTHACLTRQIETKQLKHCCCLRKLLHSNKLTRAWINSPMIENNILCCIESIEINISRHSWQNRLSYDWVTWLSNMIELTLKRAWQNYLNVEILIGKCCVDK